MNRTDDPAKSDGEYPAALDALTAAPKHHRILLENVRVRVLDTRIAPGDTVPLHTHRWPSVLYIISFSDFMRYDEHGRLLLDSRTLPSRPEAGEALWSSPLPPHTLQNTGVAELRVISMEIKDGAPKGASE